jgi:hypothetical protein
VLPAPPISVAPTAPPEPLLHVGLRPSVAVVRPLPVSALRAAPFLNRPPPPHPTGLPRAVGPLHARRRPMELPCRRSTPFAPPHCRHVVPMRPCFLLLAWHLPCGPLEISGNTLPPSSHRRAVSERATVSSRARSACGYHVGMGAAHARCRGPHRPFSPLGRATRPRPRGYFGRPRVVGRHATWAVASGQFSV